MVARERRRSAFRAARLSLFFLASLSLGWGIFRVLTARGSDVRAEEPPREAAPSSARLAAMSSLAEPREEPARAKVHAPDAARVAGLRGRIEALVASAVAKASSRTHGKANASTVSVAVHAVSVGEATDLVARLADQPLRPASNLKLVTAAAALVLLGPDWQFETLFEAHGEIRAGVLQGDLVARAGGDPLLAPEDGSAEAWMDRLCGALRRAGVTHVNGALVLDEGPYPDPAPGPSWPSEDQRWTDYCALAGGFSVGGGCLTATVRPRNGENAQTSVEPRDHGLDARLSVRTIGRKQPLSIAVLAREGIVSVQGSIPADVPEWRARFAHPDPVELFGEVVVRGLARRGITIDGRWRRERSAEGGPLVARLASPLAATLVPILRDSDNAIADQVFFATAVAATGAGTREAGRTATAQALRSLGVSSDGLVQVDGSGLSRDDRVCARQLTRLVEAVLARGGEGARLYREALPVAGETGSLDDRMRDSPARGRVRAKTGWIGGTSALCGLVEPHVGPPLVFSILVSYPDLPGLNSACFKPMQDAICETLLDYGESDG
jgi:D-alanyl-D-alanine carboxypeptidase/D-alanyl-D-alanine-endopeptidase (penicillin-binding protein 4)